MELYAGAGALNSGVHMRTQQALCLLSYLSGPQFLLKAREKLTTTQSGSVNILYFFKVEGAFGQSVYSLMKVWRQGGG